MEAPRPAFKEMVDPGNRNILGTFNARMIACAQRCIAHAREYEIPEMEERTLDFLMMTTGMDGKGREALRDALAGARTPPVALAIQSPQQANGIIQPHL